jgi:hypothetical protein
LQHPHGCVPSLLFAHLHFLDSAPGHARSLTHHQHYHHCTDTATMLSRSTCARALQSFPTSHALATRSRLFSAAVAAQGPSRAPTIADITPDSAASFNRRQQEFRDSLVAAQKQKEQQDSTSTPSYRLQHCVLSGCRTGRRPWLHARPADVHCRRSP